MKRRQFVQTTAAGTLFAAKQLNAAGRTPKTPNLLIVFPDQMRGQAMGFLGEDPVVTPHLDRFAAESLVLPQAVSNYPVCSPFRAMLMTGKYPHANGVLVNCTNLSGLHGVELREKDRCWSDVLKDKGYSLGYIGKWHLDTPREPYIDCTNNKGKVKWNDWCPPNRRHGFDFWHAYGTYNEHMNPMYWSTNARREEFKYVEQWGPEHEADVAIDYIRNTGGIFRDSSKPFALVVSMNPPHTPYDQFPKKYLKPYEGKTDKDLIVRPNVDTSGKNKMSKLALSQTKNYFANITGVDEQFGRILQALERAGLKDDTVVLFTADHGNCIGTHNEKTKNNRYEESMRIPFIIRWSGKIAPRRDPLLVSAPDIYPTLLDMLGFASDIPASVEGSSHAGFFLTGKGPKPSSQLYLKIPTAIPEDGNRGVRTAKYKLTINITDDNKRQTVLFDLVNDPYELENIAPHNKDIVDRLIKTELIPWLEKTNDPWIKHL
ncbi:MAG: sulfatase [Kiritimatiellales bacterium]|nr:sulfatase [Kiritimatiellales bacterium]